MGSNFPVAIEIISGTPIGVSPDRDLTSIQHEMILVLWTDGEVNVSYVWAVFGSSDLVVALSQQSEGEGGFVRVSGSSLMRRSNIA